MAQFNCFRRVAMKKNSLIVLFCVLLLASCNLDLNPNQSGETDWARDSSYFSVNTHGVLYLKDTYLTDDLPSDLILPTVINGITVTAIDDSVFYSNNSVKSLTIGLETLSFGNFYKCFALEKVVLEPSVKLVKESAFDYCTSLKTIEINSEGVVLEKNFATNSPSAISFVCNVNSFVFN